jgi:hypothetical protein
MPINTIFGYTVDSAFDLILKRVKLRAHDGVFRVDDVNGIAVLAGSCLDQSTRGEPIFIYYIGGPDSSGKDCDTGILEKAVETAVRAFLGARMVAVAETADEVDEKIVDDQRRSVVVLEQCSSAMLRRVRDDNDGTVIDSMESRSTTGAWRVRITESHSTPPDRQVGDSVEEPASMAGIDGFSVCRATVFVEGIPVKESVVEMTYHTETDYKEGENSKPN